MGQTVKKTVRNEKDWATILEKRFSYLTPEQRRQLLHGDGFVKVPLQELKRLKIDAYPYLM